MKRMPNATMPVAGFLVRPATAADARAMAELFAVVAAERNGIMMGLAL